MAGQYIEPMQTAAARPVSPPGRVRGWLRQGLQRIAWPCEVCGTWDASSLCGGCRQRFLADQPPACPRCALPSPGGQACGACLRQPPAFVQCVAAVPYGFPWDRLVARLKFQGQPEIAGILAQVMAERLAVAGQPGASQPAHQPPADLVLPVPLSPARLAERGYNQAWELARRLAALRGLAAQPRALQRLRDTPHQVGLSRVERQRNLRDAMWLDPQTITLAGRHVALVDDVMTTGGTAAACTQALLTAGAASVQVWVLARTPAPG